MPHYAHVLIEHANTKYPPGAVLPEDLPGLDELVTHGSAGPDKPTLNLVADYDGNVLVDGDGNEVKHIKRFDGDFTAKQIADPKVDTPLLGIHTSEEEHRSQEPHIYDAGEAQD